MYVYIMYSCCWNNNSARQLHQSPGVKVCNPLYYEYQPDQRNFTLRSSIQAEIHLEKLVSQIESLDMYYYRNVLHSEYL